MQAAPSHLSDLARGFAPEPDGAAQADKAGRGFVGQCRASAKHRLPAREPIGAVSEATRCCKDGACLEPFTLWLAPIFKGNQCLH